MAKSAFKNTTLAAKQNFQTLQASFSELNLALQEAFHGKFVAYVSDTNDREFNIGMQAPELGFITQKRVLTVDAVYNDYFNVHIRDQNNVLNTINDKTTGQLSAYSMTATDVIGSALESIRPYLDMAQQAKLDAIGAEFEAREQMQQTIAKAAYSAPTLVN